MNPIIVRAAGIKTERLMSRLLIVVGYLLLLPSAARELSSGLHFRLFLLVALVCRQRCDLALRSSELFLSVHIHYNV